MKGLIYKATDVIDGRVYIGQTMQSLVHRKSEHYRDARNGDVNYFHSALREREFEWSVLDEFDGEKDYVIHCLNVAEEYQILKHRSNEQRYGYNSTNGGYSSDKFAEHIKMRMREKSGAVKILQYDLKGNYIDAYESLSAVSAKFGVSQLKRDELLRRSWHGYMWKLDEGEINMFVAPYKPYDGHKPRIYVNVYSTESGKIIDKHLTADEASVKYNRRKDSILESSKRNTGDYYKIQECNLQPYLFIREENAPKSITVDVIKRKVVEKGEPTQKKAVDRYDIHGNFISSYDSIASASLETGQGKDAIRYSCNHIGKYNVREYFKTSIWRWKGEPLPEIVIHSKKEDYISLKVHQIEQYTLDGKFVGLHKNVRIASEATGESPALINKCMRGKVSPKNKFLWKRSDIDVEWIMPENKPGGGIREGASGGWHTVQQYTLEGVLVAEYGNVRLASEASGESVTTINACLYGRSPKKAHFIWKR